MPPLGNLRTTTQYKGKEFDNEEWLQQQYHYNQQNQEPEVEVIAETSEPAPAPKKRKRTTAKQDKALEEAVNNDLKQRNITNTKNDSNQNWQTLQN